MNTKKILSLIVAVAMIVAVVPAFGLVASAAELQTLFDASVIPTTSHGDVALSGYGMTGTAVFSTQWSESGTWNTSPWGAAGLMFFYGNSRGSSDQTKTATFNNASDSEGATKIVIEYSFAMQDQSNNYQTWSFIDNDGNTFAEVYYDQGVKACAGIGGSNATAYVSSSADVYALRGTTMKIEAVKGDSDWTVTYTNGGTVVATDTVTSINGIKTISADLGKWNNQYAAMALQGLKVTYELPDTAVDVTATYTVDGATVATEKKTYDTSTGATNVTFPEKYVYYNGEVYGAEAATLSANGEIPMSLVEHYATKAVGDSFSYDGKTYNVTGGSVIVNGNFITGDTSAWTNRPGTAITGATIAYDSEVNGNAMTISTSGASATNSVGTAWNVTAGQTYYLSFYAGGAKPDSSNYTYNRVFQSDKSTEILAYGANMTNGAWTRFETVFIPTGDTVYFQGSWASNIKYANFELLPVEEDTEASATVTVKYYTSDTATVAVKTVEKSVVKGETASFDAVSLAIGGTFYSADAVSYENVTADAEYKVVLEADTTKVAPLTDFSYNFTTGALVWAGDNGFTSSDESGTISIGWNNLRETVMAFPVPTNEGEIVTGATLHVGVGYTNTDNARYVIYAFNPSYVNIANGTMTGLSTYAAYGNEDTLLSDIGAVQVASTNVTKGNSYDIALDLSAATDLISGGVLALYITSGDQVYTYSVTTDNPPYLSPEFTTVSSSSYTVKYVDTNGTELQDSATVEYLDGTQYGYDNEVIFPNVEIPYFEGYVFKSKSVSGETVTLTYEATNTSAYFFDNVEDDTTFVSLNMLGAHDAFTASISSSNAKFDAAAIAQGDSGSKNAVSSAVTAAPMSKTQEADALTLLNSGVRYFDIRLSRSTQTAEGGLLGTTTVAHTNGVFYTTHGMLSDEFRPIAYTIAQWAKEHPGEIVVLDFQEVYDYTDGYDGNSDAATWTALNNILKEAGIYDYVTIGNASLKSHTYGSLTSNGTKANIVLFGRAAATNASIGNFILRGLPSGNAFSGRVYSNYNQFNSLSNAETIGSSFSESFIQQQVDYLDYYHTDDGDDGDHPIVFMFRVMQAQSESSNLISRAASDNASLVSALSSNPEWLSSLPVVMVDGATNNTDLYNLLHSSNVSQATTVNYVDETGATVASATKNLMIGTLYADEVAGGFVTAEDGSLYYVTEVPVTAPSDAENIVPVPYNSAITVKVAELGNVFTWQAGHINTGNLDDAGVYPAASNFGAFNWGTTAATHDRVGVAVLDAPSADADAYYLEGTQARYYGSLTAKLYAVSYEDYLAVDLTDTSALKSLLTSDRLAATITSGTQGAAVKVELDAAAVKNAVGESGKIVVLGDAYNGLYGLAAEGLAITSVSLDDVTVNLVSGGATVGTYETKTDADGNAVVPAGIYANRYYLVSDATATVGEDGTYSVEVTELGNVFTVQAGKYYASDFDAYCWNAWLEDDSLSRDRIAFAKLSVPTGADAYALSGTVINDQYNTNYTVGLDIYAITPTELAALDVGSEAAILALVSEKTAAYSNRRENNQTGLTETIVLDKAIVDAATENGEVVLIGMATRCLYGISGEDIAIEALMAAPDLTPALGWNADTSEFTIDFLFGDGITGTYTINVVGEGGFTASTEVELSDDVRGAAFSTVNTNRIYKAYVAGTVNGAETAKVSVYSLVTDAILSGGFGALEADGTYKTVAANQIEAVNKVLSSGGIYIAGGALTADSAKIMTYDAEAGTITLTDDAYNAGLRFTSVKAAVDSDEATEVVSEDGKTIQLSEVSMAEAEAEFFELEDVELVLVPEVVEESTADEQVEIVLDFEEIL